jgi:ribosomal protein S18 acetylase RimI-like enzyme
MQINKVEIDKLDDVYQIITECHQWLTERGLEQWKYYTLDVVRKKFEDHDVFMITEDNEPIGSVFLSMEKPYYYTDEDNNYFTDPESTGVYITGLGVRPQFHGKGYAKELLKFIESYAKSNNVKYLRLDARGDYKEVIKFYRDWGFNNVGSVVDEGSEYIFMEKIL